MPSSSEKESTPIFAVLAAVVFVASCWMLTLWLGREVDATTRGTFGDMFGAANAAFSGLAFVGIIYAIFLQRSEVKIAKDDLRTTQLIFGEQIKQLEKQSVAIRTKSFEDTYFKLISVLNESINSTVLKQTMSNGRERSEKIYTGRQALFETSNMILRNCERKDDEIIPNAALKYVYDFGSQTLAPIEMTIDILHYIDSSDVDDESLYIDVLKSNTGPELYWIILFYAIGSKDDSLARRLIDEYKFFERFYLPQKFDYLRKYFAPTTFSNPSTSGEFSPPMRIVE